MAGEPLLSPLNMVVKQAPVQAGLSWKEGGKATRVFAGYQPGSEEVGRRLGKAVSGRLLPAGAVFLPGLARACPSARPDCAASSCTTSLGGEGTAQGRGARATPTEVWTCYTHMPSQRAAITPRWGSGQASAMRNRLTQAHCSGPGSEGPRAGVSQPLEPLHRDPLSTGPSPIAHPARRGGEVGPPRALLCLPRSSW